MGPLTSLFFGSSSSKKASHTLPNTFQPASFLTPLVVLALVVLCLVLRLPLRVPRLDSWDEVDFALGMERYSLSEYQPHFPGYPVFLWIARSLLPWTGEEIAALNLVSAVLGGLTPLPFFLLGRDFTAGKQLCWPLCS